MANNENGKSVDYFDLRRKHQEYKKGAAKQPEEVETSAPRPAPAEDAPFMRSAAEDAYEDERPVEDASAYEGDDYNEEDELEDSGANPFQSFISAFNKVRDRLAARREGRGREVLDDSDDGYDDEEPQEERRGPFRFLRRHEEEEYDEPDEFPPVREALQDEDVSPAEDVPSAEDAPEDAPIAEDVPEAVDMEETLPRSEEIPVPGAADDETNDEYEDEEAPRSGGFKKFVSLFVVREDRIEDEPIGEDDYEIEERPVRIPEARGEEYDDSLFTRPRGQVASEEEHKSMGEQENNKDNMTELMAEGLDDGTLSRRERRLLRERQEAQARASESEAPQDATIDEPTREYKPVPRPQAQENDEAPGTVQSLFGGDNRKPAEDEDEDYDEPKSRKRGRRDDYGDEDDDYDEPKSRKRGRRDDYDDEDDDYEPKSRKRGRRDDYDDEDDDYEPKLRRRGRRDVYDDEDDEPRRGRRYNAYEDDDYDDYDDYDDAPSFGHYVLGFFKVLIAVVLVLAVALFGLYFADQAVPGGVGAYGWLREKAPVIDKILPPGEDDAADAGDASDMLDTSTTSPDTNTTSPDESTAPETTDAGTVG